MTEKNFTVTSSTILLFHAIMYAFEVNATLTAISDSPYTNELYNSKKNEDPPSERDPARMDAHTRKSICEDILASGFFNSELMTSASLTALKHPRNSDILHKMYRRTKSRFKSLLYPYEYTNFYELKEFPLVGIRERVFVCPFRRRFSDIVVPVYVSKEYNISQDERYTPARFLFWSRGNMALAEEPAEAYARDDYNLELHYLQLREGRQPEENPNLDPVCKLASNDHHDQYRRICTSILTSSYFNSTTYTYFIRNTRNNCSKQQVGFRTAEAQEKAAGVRYYELMLNCNVLTAQGFSSIFISRAYTSRQVFVYTRQSPWHSRYLENLTTNVNIVRELGSLNDVE